MKKDDGNKVMSNILSRQKSLKTIAIVSALVCYIAILNVISHARGPFQYEAEEDSPLAEVGSFVSFSGEIAASDRLVFSNSAEGNAVGYLHDITLSGLERIQVSFTVDCPPQYAGTSIIIDLYNPIVGYDSPEQEEVIILQEGINEITAVLVPGENAPDEAQLRLFTGNITDVSAEYVEVYSLRQLPKVTPSMVVAIFLPVSVLIVSGAVLSFSKRKG